jgi:hypothetical protein
MTKLLFSKLTPLDHKVTKGAGKNTISCDQMTFVAIPKIALVWRK